jgi:hypothetical protein
VSAQGSARELDAKLCAGSRSSRLLDAEPPPETLALVTRARDFRADAKQMAQGVYRQRVELFSKVRASGAQHATFPDTAAVLFLALAAL